MPLSEKNKKILVDKITGTFMWTFKKGDNIVYNFEILWSLYEAKKHYTGNKQLYNKPITITLISIIECILEDFVNRMRGRVRDPLPSISEEIAKDFMYKKRGDKLEVKQLKKFNHYVYILKKHKIFGGNQKFYETLDELRDIRNRVHIQKSGVDEERIFTERNLRLSEGALKKIIKFMVEKYPRWETKCSAENIPYPWEKL